MANATQQMTSIAVTVNNTIINKFDQRQDDEHFDVISFIYSFSGWSSLCIGVPLNLFVIWLVLNKTMHAMLNYARILLVSSIMDIILLLITSTVQPILIAAHGYRLLIEIGLFRLIPGPYTQILDSIWLQLAVGFHINTTFQQIFRYLLIIKYKKIPRKIVWMLIGLAICANALHYISLFWCYWPLPEYALKIGEMTKIIEKETGINDVHITSFSIVRSFAWEVHYVLMVILFIGCYAAIIYCALNIRSHFKNLIKRKSSPEEMKKNEINKQIGRALMIQAILPTIEVFAFGMIIVLPLLFTTNTIYYILFAALPLYFIPVLNPLGTILIVGTYRKYAVNLFRMKLNMPSRT